MSAVTRPTSQSISHAQKQKPVEWISSLIQRYQDQLPTRTGKSLDRESREMLNTTHSCIVNVSKHHLHLVVLALVRVLKAVNASRWTAQGTLAQSRFIILETLLECLQEAQPITGRNMEREACVKAILDEMWLIISAGNSTARDKAVAVVARVGDLNASVLMARAERALTTMQEEEVGEDALSTALSHVTLMAYATLELDLLIKFIQMVTSFWPPRKEHLEAVCSMISSVIWRWIERYPEHFSTLQHSPQEHITEVMDNLFMAMNTPELRRRAICWPVQTMLIAVSPCSLEAIAHADQEGVVLPEIVVMKRQFVDQVASHVQSGVAGASRSPWSAQLHYACHAAVNLCKCATYVNLSDFFVFNVVQQLVEHVKVVLLTGARPREMERAVLVDCFVALFRLKFDNDVFRVCFSSSQPLFQLVLVEALTIIASQDRLHWWPRIDMLMSRSDQLRALLLNVLEKVLEQEQPSSGHIQLRMNRAGTVTQESWHKVSGRWKAERPSSVSLGSSSSNDSTHQTILIAIIRLIETHPRLLIRKKTESDENCIESVVSSVVLLIEHPLLQTHSMQALLALHKVVPDWNCNSRVDALSTFFTVSSHMLFSVCQKLIHLQISNADNVIHWLKALMKKRNDYIFENAELITPEMIDGITYQSIVKFEVVCFLYLWNCSAELVLCCISLFSLHARQCSQLPQPRLEPSLARIIGSQPPSAICTAGRIALQKSVNRIIRSLPYSNAASSEAWHETIRVWELFTNQLVNASKDHADFVEHVTKVTTDSSDSAAMVETWCSMSGFLCAFSHLISVKEPNHVINFFSRLLSVLRMEESTAGREVICKCVKELLSYEVDTSLDHQLLQVISTLLSSHASNDLFVEHVIYILKNILSRRQALVLRVDSTSQMLSALLHSQYASDRTLTQKMTFMKKLCSLLQVVVSNGSARRLPSSLQSRMLECLSSWIASLPPPMPVTSQRLDILLPVLGALTRLLSNISIPIQPATFDKLFNDLLESFQECSLTRSSPLLSRNPLEDIHTNSSALSEMTRRCNDALLSALAALISANAELGLSRVLECAWSGEWRARGWLLSTLCRLLSEYAPPSASPIDKQGSLVEILRLVKSSPEDGSLPLVTALANGLPGDSLERLCRVLVAAFADELPSLLYSVLWQEAESALSPSTLFRGSSFGAKLISCCLRIFGQSYLLRTLRPLLEQQIQQQSGGDTPSLSHFAAGASSSPALSENNAEGVSLTLEGAELAFDLIISSLPQCPPRFRLVCRQIYLVINQRFPGLGISALGKILFLRFFNPAIVSPYELQVSSRRPSPLVSRRLTLVSKILQTAVNRPSSCRDPCLSPFLPLINQKTEPLNQFLTQLVEETTEEGTVSLIVPPSANIPLMLNLHALFIADQPELMRQLRFTSCGPSMFSRVDAVLRSLPSDIALPPTPTETLDPSLPFFIQLTTTNPPVYAVILRRFQNVEVENAAKHIAEKCGRTKWICLLDGLMCYDPPNLMKMFSADAFAHIDRIVVLHCSTQLFNRLIENFSLLQTLRINFDPVSLNIPLDSLPYLSRVVLSTPNFSFPATLISTVDIPVSVKLWDNVMTVAGERNWGEETALLTDFYQCTDFEQIELVWADTVSLVQGDTVLTLRCDAQALLNHICAERTRVSGQETGGVLSPLRAHSLELLSLAFIHLTDCDISVRSTAYRLLSSLAATLHLPAFASLQETPCVFVPAGSQRFLASTARCLVSAEPELMCALVPRLLDIGSITLLHAMEECWPSVASLREEQRAELFGALASATSAGGALSAAICDCVWPRIGQMDDVTLRILLSRLESACPLSTALSVVQATCSGGERLAALVMECAITQLHSPHPSLSLSRLLAFLLVLTFDASTVFLDTQLANLMHIVACVAGAGSSFQRAASFALVSNLFHSFGSNPDLQLSEEMRRSLSLFVRQLCSDEALRLFRVSAMDCGQNLVHFAMQYIDSDSRSDKEALDYTADEDPSENGGGSSVHADLHQILNLIIGLIQDLQGGLPTARDWLSEWRVLARHWALEGSADVQIRSLIAFSCLAETISDQEIKSVLQLLLQVIKRRECLGATSGVSLCLVRLHTLTASNSPIHRLVFWISIMLFQLENAVIYEHAIQLLHANITNLDHMGVFEHTSLEKLAMEARLPLEWDFKTLDQCAGLSFRKACEMVETCSRSNFNFALVGYLLKDLRQPALSVKVVQLLQLLLKISAKSHQHNPYVLTKDNLPFLVALLPFDDKVQTRFRVTITESNTVARSVLSAPWSTFEAEDKTKGPEADKEGGRRETQGSAGANGRVVAEQGGQQPSAGLTASGVGWGEDEEEESGALLDPAIVCGEQQQALAVTVLAILARSCPNVDIILDYLLEACNVFPAVVPVVECLLDQRIIGLVQSCQSPRMLSTIVRLIESSASGESGGPQQAVYFLQQCGFAGLWRYAGAFLSQRASLQAINANLCSCLECTLASL